MRCGHTQWPEAGIGRDSLVYYLYMCVIYYDDWNDPETRMKPLNDDEQPPRAGNMGLFIVALVELSIELVNGWAFIHW